jgi:uncharacterized membrane protein
MRNRIVGLVVIGIAALIGFIIFSFNQTMTSIISTSCSHGTSCPMWGTLEFQTNLSTGVAAFVAAVGFYLTFFGEEEKIITRIKRIHEQVQPRQPSIENYKDVLVNLEPDERKVFERVIETNGDVLQSDIVTELGGNKVRVTRILDKLESMNLVERRRRGMTNVIVMKR